MLYSFKIHTSALPQNAYVTVTDGALKYRFVARTGHTQHFYTNIVVESLPTIGFEPPHTFEELAFGGGVYLTEEQQILNRKLARDRNTTYRVTTKGTPKRAIVTFPHYKGVGGWATPYAILDGTKFDFDDCLYISFQEPYFTMGSYFLADNWGGDPVPTAVEVITRELGKYGLTAENSTFLGASKGANIAALVSHHFDGNQLILSAYSTALEHRVRTTDYAHLATTLDYFEVEFPDALAILEHEGQAKETHWFYSVADDLANQGNQNLVAKHLATYPSMEAHQNVVTGHWEEIRALIDTRHR